MRDTWLSLTVHQSFSSLETPQSATRRHLSWRWKPLTMKPKVDIEQEKGKERKLFGRTHDSGDLIKMRLTRDFLAKHFLAPWFEDSVKGTA